MDSLANRWIKWWDKIHRCLSRCSLDRCKPRDNKWWDKIRFLYSSRCTLDRCRCKDNLAKWWGKTHRCYNSRCSQDRCRCKDNLAKWWGKTHRCHSSRCSQDRCRCKDSLWTRWWGKILKFQCSRSKCQISSSLKSANNSSNNQRSLYNNRSKRANKSRTHQWVWGH
jgi:hypothetical protein